MTNKPNNTLPATKSELKKEVHGLRIDLKKTEKTLRGEILRVEERVENLEEGQERIEKTLNKISTQLDGFIGRVDSLTVDNTVGANQIHELRENVKDHEVRIAKLESAN